MTVDEISKIFSQIGVLDVLRISGGEPFIRKDLADIVNAIDVYCAPSLIHFTTNGILTNRIVETISRIKSLDKIHIKVSIDDIGVRHDEIRGVSGAYEKAMATVRALLDFRQRGLHVGVNQGIVDAKSLASYEVLKGELSSLKVPLYASIAYDSSYTLYSEGEHAGTIDVASTCRPFSPWKSDELTAALRKLTADNKKNSDMKERLIDSYFVNGLYERMVEKQFSRGPKCVALNNHMRLLPNGDVPICLHNGTVVGNLRERSFEDVWFGGGIDPHRQWVRDCPGCWVSCETAISAIYTGDIWKGFRKTHATQT